MILIEAKIWLPNKLMWPCIFNKDLDWLKLIRFIPVVFDSINVNRREWMSMRKKEISEAFILNFSECEGIWDI
jgi:hypothetical protein